MLQIKENLVPLCITSAQQGITYASEAEFLNVALFGKTSKDWRLENPKSNGNIRDYATIQQLIVLSNLESMNAELIKQGLSQSERLLRLNKMAIEQLTSLLGNPSIKRLESEGGNEQ